ncbi:MAG TPA: molybdopterin cofactor-binding domain-containing protein, partial [Polyangiaceae bacterium]
MKDGVVGKPLDRVDAIAKVTGKAPFTADVSIAGLAHGVIVSATISKGRVASIDTAAARALPGVIAILTHENAPKLPGAKQKKDENARVVQVLQDDAVAYDAQPIALVIADTIEHARHAAELVSARYETASGSYTIETADVQPFTPSPSKMRPPWDERRGDPESAFRSAAVRVEQTYETPLENHNPMETHTTTAVWQGDRLTLYDATQGIFGVKKRIAEIFGIPADDVRVVSHFIGGGFGSKGSPWSHVALAAMGARVTKRPVRIVVTRHQMFSFVGHRPRTVQRVSLGAD